MNSIPFNPRTSELLSGVDESLTDIATQVRETVSRGLEQATQLFTLEDGQTPDELLTLAREYDATQPSYASDLRTAAAQPATPV